MTIVIEKGIPLPTRERSSKYGFENLGVMESVLITDIPVQTVRNSVSAKNKRGDKKFIAKAGIYGTRIWRVK